ncbi:MAG TPA: fumarate hydratase, partial [Kiritimatiellia bacterium]|nr:fumarate hydratase [Kiritimatiellia bacterium]
MDWTETLAELIRRTTSDLPRDVEAALRTAEAAEPAHSQAARLLRAIGENSRLARAQSTPLCQDTGTLTFFWRVPRESDTLALEEATREAVALATRNGWLRRNTIDTLTGSSVDENVAEDCPVCHIEQADTETTEVWLLQKGGGCENMSTQFSLPDEALGAGRDMEGVRRCLL